VYACVCMNDLGVAVTEWQLARSCMAVLDSPCLACTKHSKPEKQPRERTELDGWVGLRQLLISAPAGHRYPCSIPLVYGSPQLRVVVTSDE
jgi:hypothetical protein